MPSPRQLLPAPFLFPVASTQGEPEALVPSVAEGLYEKPYEGGASRELAPDYAAGAGQRQVLAIEKDELEGLGRESLYRCPSPGGKDG